jgi:hypothetical protein
MIFTEIEWEGVDWLIWLRIGTCGGLLKIGIHRRRGISWLAERASVFTRAVLLHAIDFYVMWSLSCIGPLPNKIQPVRSFAVSRPVRNCRYETCGRTGFPHFRLYFMLLFKEIHNRNEQLLVRFISTRFHLYLITWHYSCLLWLWRSEVLFLAEL